MYEMNPFLERIWRYGQPPDIWIKNIDIIKKFISKNNIKPMSPEDLAIPQYVVDLQPITTSKRIPFKPQPPPGGIRLAHLHYQDKFYMLSSEQWKDFAGGLIIDFQKKLATVKTISFEQAKELSTAIDSLP